MEVGLCQDGNGDIQKNNLKNVDRGNNQPKANWSHDLNLPNAMMHGPQQVCPNNLFSTDTLRIIEANRLLRGGIAGTLKHYIAIATSKSYRQEHRVTTKTELEYLKAVKAVPSIQTRCDRYERSIDNLQSRNEQILERFASASSREQKKQLAFERIANQKRLKTQQTFLSQEERRYHQFETFIGYAEQYLCIKAEGAAPDQELMKELSTALDTMIAKYEIDLPDATDAISASELETAMAEMENLLNEQAKQNGTDAADQEETAPKDLSSRVDQTLDMLNKRRKK